MASSNKGSARSGDLTAALVLEEAGKRYGEVVAVAPVSLVVQPGERVALLGPSGSGKTTLLMLLGGELRPTMGAVRVHGTDLAQIRQGPRLARMVGMIHQQFDLVSNLSALQNALAGRLGQWGMGKAMLSLVWPQDRQAAMAALERVGVAGRSALRAGRLSGGEQQRVAIARLLLQDPAIILADEPVSSLDPTRAEEIVQLLVEVAAAGDKTVVASLHSVALARKHFTRLVGLRNGFVVFDLPAARITEAILQELYQLEGLRVE